MAPAASSDLEAWVIRHGVHEPWRSRRQRFAWWEPVAEAGRPADDSRFR